MSFGTLGTRLPIFARFETPPPPTPKHSECETSRLPFRFGVMQGHRSVGFFANFAELATLTSCQVNLSVLLSLTLGNSKPRGIWWRTHTGLVLWHVS